MRQWHSGTGGGVITFTPPRPRPSLGQFTGVSNGAGSGSGGQADGSFDGSGVSSGNQPAVSRATDRANADSKREQNRKLRAEQQQLRSEREAAERRALERQRQSRNSQRLAQQQRAWNPQDRASGQCAQRKPLEHSARRFGGLSIIFPTPTVEFARLGEEHQRSESQPRVHQSGATKQQQAQCPAPLKQPFRLEPWWPGRLIHQR